MRRLLNRLRDLYRQIVLVDWAKRSFDEALRLIPAMVFVLAAGLVAGDPPAGAIAASGALTVGFGAFQQFTRAKLGPMLFAAAGASVSTLLGTLAGSSTTAIAALALVYGFLCGVLPAIGMGAFWVGQQCAVFLIVASAYAEGVDYALQRTELVLAGGAAQIVVYGAIGRYFGRTGEAANVYRMIADARLALSGLRFHMRPASPYFQFALRFALVLSLAVLTERLLALPNGYWVAMTALLLMRPDFQDTLIRSLARFFGTLAGAVIATLITHLLAPGPFVLAVLVAGFAFCAFAALRINYGLFAVFVTGYVIFLLSLAGLDEASVADARVVSTLLGGGFALAAHVDFYLLRRRAAADRAR